MSGFVRGPFTVKYAGNTILDIEQATVALTQDTQQKTTLAGIKREFDGPILCTVTIKVMRSDIATLSVLLPQYFVPSGGTLSTTAPKSQPATPPMIAPNAAPVAAPGTAP